MWHEIGFQFRTVGFITNFLSVEKNNFSWRNSNSPERWIELLIAYWHIHRMRSCMTGFCPIACRPKAVLCKKWFPVRNNIIPSDTISFSATLMWARWHTTRVRMAEFVKFARQRNMHTYACTRTRMCAYVRIYALGQWYCSSHERKSSFVRAPFDWRGPIGREMSSILALLKAIFLTLAIVEDPN